MFVVRVIYVIPSDLVVLIMKIWVGIWTRILIYFKVPEFKYKSKIVIGFGKVTYNLLWNENCKLVAGLDNSDNEKRRRKSVS